MAFIKDPPVAVTLAGATAVSAGLASYAMFPDRNESEYTSANALVGAGLATTLFGGVASVLRARTVSGRLFGAAAALTAAAVSGTAVLALLFREVEL